MSIRLAEEKTLSIKKELQVRKKLQFIQQIEQAIP